MGPDALMTRQFHMGYPEASYPIMRQGDHQEPIFLDEGDRAQAGVRRAAAGADDADDYTDRGPLADGRLKSAVPEFHDGRKANKRRQMDTTMVTPLALWAPGSVSTIIICNSSIGVYRNVSESSRLLG